MKWRRCGDSQVKSLADMKATADATIATTIKESLGLAGGALVIGLGLAFVIGRGIAKPMNGLTAGMNELAGGNFDVVLPGVGRKDEIGEIAGAVETFKVKSAEKARAEAQANADRNLREAAEKAERDRLAAEEKIEQDKRAAAERAAAEAKVMADLDAAVGGIVNAAMAGDFSQRVPLDGKDGVIRNLAASMNGMCETIGKVMDDLVAMLGSLADGDLTRRIDAEYRGAFATLKDSANSTADQLSDTVAKIKSAADEVTNASAEISTSTTDLSQRTEEQARQPRRNVGVDGADFRDGAKERRERPAGQRAPPRKPAMWRTAAARWWRAPSKPCRGSRIPSRKIADIHRRDRRDRAADQPTRAQCRGRGGAGGAMRDAASRLSPRKCAAWRSVRRRPRRTSRISSPRRPPRFRRVSIW